MVIEITPLDTLFFRDGRPFTMGDDTWANGMFPPSPSVFYGALRSVYFSHKKPELCGNFQDQIAQIEKLTEQFEIRGIYYKIGEESTYVPLPLDCVKEKGSDENSPLQMLSLERISETRKEIATFSEKYPFEYLLTSQTFAEVESVEDGIIEGSEFQQYLTTCPAQITISRWNALITSEPKIGIGRSNETHASEDSALYRVDGKRLENKNHEKLSFVLDCTNLESFPVEGILKLGGEGKTAKFQVIQDHELINRLLFCQSPIICKYFKLVLTTPAIFEKGWLPKWSNDDNEFYRIFPNAVCRFKLIAAALGKPIFIGGFNMKPPSGPKPMRKAVPAGSVYYFEIVDQYETSVTDVFKSIVSISDDENDRKQGFGLYYLGGVKCNR